MGYFLCQSAGLTLDISRMDFDPQIFDSNNKAIGEALAAMGRIEAGHRANADEKDDDGNAGRMVGHYWLRDTNLIANAAALPGVNDHLTPELKQQIKSNIKQTLADIKVFASDIRSGAGTTRNRARAARHRALHDQAGERAWGATG